MNETDLIERDLKRDIWQETLDAVRDIKVGKVGRVKTKAEHHFISRV